MSNGVVLNPFPDSASICSIWNGNAGVLGGEQMLRLLTQPLSAETAKGAGVNWRTAEAALFCVRSISRSALLSTVHMQMP